MMKRMLLATLVATLLVGCDNKPEPETSGVIPVSFRPVINGETFQTGTPYKNLQGRDFQFDGFSLYVSEISLIDEAGNEVALNNPDQEESVWLFDFAKGEVYGSVGSLANNGALSTGSLEVPAGTYTGASFTIGVPTSLNGDFDPVTYNSGHPLSEQRGAFWTWNSGYIFLKIDGRFDNSPDANGQSLDGSLTYHIGLDTLIRKVSYTFPAENIVVTTGDDPSESLDFTLDVNKLFYFESDTLDMMSDNLTHTTNDFELATTITTNLSSHAINLE